MLIENSSRVMAKVEVLVLFLCFYLNLKVNGQAGSDKSIVILLAITVT